MGALLMDRLPVGRSAILMALTFVVSIGIGWVVTRPFATTAPQQITTVDYVAVVAQLFQHDHNAAIARERLNLLGSPSALVQQAVQAAADGKVKSSSDRVALDTLAQALKVPVSKSELAAAAATPATPASASVSTPSAVVTSTTADTAVNSSGGHVSWVGPVAAFILAFVLGAIVLMRTAGLGMPSLSLPRVGLPERKSRFQPGGATRAEAAPYRRPANVRRATPVVDPDLEDDDEDLVPVEPIRERPAARAAASVRARPAPVRTPPRRTAYQSVYRLGDDPYDEIHPIADPITGSLVAACGLTAALKIESSGAPRYYAFTAWVQDYVSGDQLHAVGLVTSWALENQRAEIDDWVKAGQIEEVYPVQPGLSGELRTDDLSTTVTIPDVDYGDYGGAKASYFSQLTVRFDVQPGAGRGEI